MKKLLFVLGLALIMMARLALAADYDFTIDNTAPQTITAEIKVDNWVGSQLKSFDVCLRYDSSVLSVNSMQINDTSVGGCVAAGFSITNDNGTDCVRLGGGIFPGTTCPVADDYLLATVVFEVLTEDVTDLCVGDCTATDYFPCSHNFTDYIEDETGTQYPSMVCINEIAEADWHIETVDSEGSLGDYSSLALDSSNNPHITYYEWDNRDLKYAHYDGTWHMEVLEYAGITSLAIDSNDNLHISYRGDSYLKYFYYDGSWHKETIDILDTSGSWGSVVTSLALESSGNPHISYFDCISDDLNYAYYNNGSWHIETVDSTGDVGGYNSIAIDSLGNPHISYYDFTNQYLKYAHYDGIWHIEIVDSSGDMGKYSSLALDSSNNPHISYFDGSNSDLRYAHYDGSWHLETIDSSGNVGSYASLALDNLDNIHISYYDQETVI